MSDHIDPAKKPPHTHYAARQGAGYDLPVTVAKNGVRHIRRHANGEEKEILSIGLACSECFSGPRLAKVLMEGFELEKKIMEDLMNSDYAAPLCIHTSSGASEALGKFIEALEPHLPWKDTESSDWILSLQMEGASAVWAAIDLCLQEQMLTTGNKRRKMVAVGAKSYHGPPSTSFGARSPLWHKNYQVLYPVPTPGGHNDEAKLLSQFEAFLDKHAEEVGVMLVEPQWGSSQASFVWPKGLLQQYVKLAKARGIRIVSDEIMCGLGRHGHGTCFLAEAWELDPDAVTFGKAISGGAYPLSGAVMKRGQKLLASHGRSVMQSHTFAGAHTRALMTGAAILNELPQWFESIGKLGEELTHIFRYLSNLSEGMLIQNGQGLLWGCMFSSQGPYSDDDYRHDTIECFKKHCEEVGVCPYFIPAGGFMVTPVIDIDVGTIYEIGVKLEEVVRRTINERRSYCSGNVNLIKNNTLIKQEFNANQKDFAKGGDMAKMDTNKENTTEVSGKCSPLHHETRSCTKCTSFVCRDVRMRFVPI